MNLLKGKSVILHLNKPSGYSVLDRVFHAQRHLQMGCLPVESVTDCLSINLV